MARSEEARDDINGFGRVMSVLLVLALSAANSALFYFVIWDMFQPSQPYTVILFFISGGAHLTYFFLPWFIRNQLAPIFAQTAVNASGASSNVAEGSELFVKLSTQLGLALCVTALVIWALQQEFPWSAEEADTGPLITEANCQRIGGTPTVVDGRLSCVLPVVESQGGAPGAGTGGSN